MKRSPRRIAALLMAMVLIISLSIPAFAVENGDESLVFGGLGEKKSEALVTPGQYEITVSVPGAVETEEYSEIIVMVDASDSQTANLTKLKTMLVEMAEEVLHNDGSTRLTLMGYGMGPTRVGSFYNAATLEAYLENVTTDDLMQGVSATNCEGALDFVREYIEQSEKLNKTFVIFTSDGMTNMDETPFDLSTWTEHPEWYFRNYPLETVATYAALCQKVLLNNSGTIVSPTIKLYPALSLKLIMTQMAYGLGSAEYTAVVDELYNTITATTESAVAYTNAVWADVFANSGLTFGAEGLYSTSELEKAFLDYYDGAFLDSFLCSVHRMANAGFYPDWYNLATWGARAAEAADNLADNDKVLELYMMDFANKTKTWMNPDSTGEYHCTSDKITYNTATNFGAAVDKIATLSDEMFVTVYKNTTVTDPMSKWVKLDPSTIRIYEDDLLIYQYGEGWLYEDKQPAADPITLKVNEDGRYQITWRIKDGNLLYTDRYFLKYIVDVDETAEGFEYDKMYPANDATYVNYTDANGDPQTTEVEVPEVKQPTTEDHFDEGEKGFEIYKGSSIDGTPISGIQFDIYHVVPADGEALNPNPTEEEYGKYMTEENLVGSIITDANGYGYLNLTDLGYGDGFYLIVEQPNEKVKAPVAPFYVSIPMLDPESMEPMDVVVMYPKNTPVIPDEPLPPDLPDEPEKPETGKITILKHSAVSEDVVLEGAQFQVYRIAGEDEEPVLTVQYEGQELGLVPVMVDEQAVTITTDATGYGTSAELPIGLYFLVETKAPDGYNLSETSVPVFVTATSHEVLNAVKIPNTAGVQLPETGGPGTLMYTVMGLMLCAAAAFVLLMQKRRTA